MQFIKSYYAAYFYKCYGCKKPNDLLISYLTNKHNKRPYNLYHCRASFPFCTHHKILYYCFFILCSIIVSVWHSFLVLISKPHKKDQIPFILSTWSWFYYFGQIVVKQWSNPLFQPRKPL